MTPSNLCLISSLALAALAGLAGSFNARVLTGVAAGAAWNFASLWCLINLLSAWLGPQPSRRRALGWLVVKFPVLYALAVLLVRHAQVSVLGFSVGFTAVMAVSMGWFAVQANRRTVKVYGR